jgi:hypothetical protein
LDAEKLSGRLTTDWQTIENLPASGEVERATPLLTDVLLDCARPVKKQTVVLVRMLRIKEKVERGFDA